MAFDYFHSTTIQAAEIASKANVKQLCLTHISSRYGKEEWVQLEREAKNVFPHSVIVHDFTEIPID
jgi:ribonuclease Z